MRREIILLHILFMVARGSVTSTGDFDSAPLVPDEVRIALWPRMFTYLQQIVKPKRSWHVRGEALKIYHQRRSDLSAEIDRELAQGSAQGSHDGFQR